MSELILNEKKDIVIYGAGKYAEKVYGYLKLRELLPAVRYVVVSDDEKHEGTFHELEIFNLNEKTDEMKDCQVIVAISPAHSMEVRESLDRIGVTDVIVVEKEFIAGLIEEYGRICKRFPVQRNKVFFDAYNGSGYTCNCKYIAEKIRQQDPEVQLVWDLVSTEANSLPDDIKCVLRDSPEYYYELYTSAVVVFNATINPNILYKKKEQYFINTWHGIGPFKKVGNDVNSKDRSEYVIQAYNRIVDLVDLMTAASDHCVGVYRDSIGYNGEIQKWGYPRNDVFFANNRLGDAIREKYGIDRDCRIVLYAPTYRQKLQGADVSEVLKTYDLDGERIVKSLEKRFDSDFVFLYRFHHLIHKSTAIDRIGKGYGIDVTLYPDMQELLATADILITDWSSSIWDFSLAREQGKRIFLYHNDVTSADEQSGFYLPPAELPFPKGSTTEEVCEAIEAFDEERYLEDADRFIRQYGSYDDGHASERVAERIFDVMHHPEKYGKG